MNVAIKKTGAFLPQAVNFLKPAAKLLSGRGFWGKLVASRLGTGGTLGSLYKISSLDSLVSPSTARLVEDMKEFSNLKDVQLRPCYFDQPKTFSFKAWGEAGGKSVTAGGTSGNFSEAFDKAVFEYCERFNLSLVPEGVIRKFSQRHLAKIGVSHIDTRKLDLLATPKETLVDSRLGWVSCEYLGGGEVLAPAQAVLWMYRQAGENGKEPFIFHPNSNGCAVFSSKFGALNRAMYELAERDSFLLYWLNGVAPSRLDPVSLGKEVAQLFNECVAYRFEPHLLSVPTDTGVPVVVSILADSTDKGAKMICSAAAASTYQAAALKTLRETLSGIGWARSVFEAGKRLKFSYENTDLISSIEDRMLFWSDPVNFKKLEWFISGRMESADTQKFSNLHFNSETEEFEYLRGKLEGALGCSPGFFYGVSSPLLKRHGLFVVKVVVPGLLPMFFNEKLAPLQAQRLRLASRQVLGKEFSLNRLPHPFV